MNDILDDVYEGRNSNTKKIIKRIGVISSAKVTALTMAGMSLFFVLIFVLLGNSFSGFLGFYSGGLVTMVILVPIIYAIFGFVAGALFALIYNVIAGSIGGIEIEIADA